VYPEGHDATQAPSINNPEAQLQTPFTDLVPLGQFLTQSPLDKEYPLKQALQTDKSAEQLAHG
jgi:hypothetical protein